MDKFLEVHPCSSLRSIRIRNGKGSIRQYAIIFKLEVLTLLTALAFTLAIPDSASAANITKCSPNQVCYCVNSDLRDAIEKKVVYFRGLIADQKNKGKAVGYLSVPLSGSQGGIFSLNRKISAVITKHVESRFGADSIWILDPATMEGDLPASAKQADYMLMWTEILEGNDGLGRDFDVVYFVGPQDFADFFGFDGQGDLGKLDVYFDQLVANDLGVKKAVESGKLSKASFRSYYGLRASVAFSAGAHDEWNIVRLINQKRRGDPKYGIVGQLPMFFDQRAVPSGDFEASVAPGNVAACKN